MRYGNQTRVAEAKIEIPSEKEKLKSRKRKGRKKEKQMQKQTEDKQANKANTVCRGLQKSSSVRAGEGANIKTKNRKMTQHQQSPRGIARERDEGISATQTRPACLVVDQQIDDEANALAVEHVHITDLIAALSGCALGAVALQEGHGLHLVHVVVRLALVAEHLV
jgi:hypothetical protein